MLRYVHKNGDNLTLRVNLGFTLPFQVEVFSFYFSTSIKIRVKLGRSKETKKLWLSELSFFSFYLFSLSRPISLLPPDMSLSLVAGPPQA